MSDNNLPILNDGGTLLLYEGNGGKVRVEISYFNETFWLTQKKMAELFGVDVRTVNEHLKNIFADNELASEATIRKFRIVRREGNREVTRDIEHYTLDAVISVGYRVNSVQATQFRFSPCTQRTGRLSAKTSFPSCTTTDSGYTRLNNTRQGYARKRTLKSAGYFFLGRDR